MIAIHESFPSHGKRIGSFTKMSWASTGFTPSGSPIGHWSADTITGLSDGDPVGTWPDQSGNSYDLIQATAEKKPLYKIDVKNGKPSVRFDGDDDYFIKSFGTVYTQPNTVFIVTKCITVLGANNRIFSGWSTTNREVLYNSGTQFALYAGAALNDGNVDTDWHIFTMLSNGASSSLRNNTVASTGDAGANNLDGVRLSCDTSDINPSNIDVLELIIYDGNEDPTDNEAGLNAKYAIY